MIDHQQLLRENFESFVRMAFRYASGGEELGDDPYLSYICQEVAAAKVPGARLVVNLPPRHLKTFSCSVCLAAWLLARNPGEKIIVVTYNDKLATDISYQIRAILKSAWFMKYFPGTRLASDRTRVNDFATTEGGGVFAVSAEGGLTGRGASIIIFDDPLAVNDAGNREQRDKINALFDTLISPRLNNSRRGRIVIVAHRLHPDDLTGHVMKSGGWTRIALPFIAPRDQDYDLGARVWHRKKGELLRPDAFLEDQIRHMKTTTNPDFETLYQQFLGDSESIRITRSQFDSFTDAPAGVPVVISVDPGHRPGPGHSSTVIQAWASVQHKFLLLDQWRAQVDVNRVIEVLRGVVVKTSAAVVLIEDTGFGLTLYHDLHHRFPALQVDRIQVGNRSKTVRLLEHVELIARGGIALPEDADWLEDYLDEFERFPHGPSDDQVDATTQYLDFMAKAPLLKQPKARDVGVLANASPGRSQLPYPFSRGRPTFIAPFGNRKNSQRLFPREDR